MIVSDSTGLIVLFDNGKIELLGNLFEKVYIPKGVFEELESGGEVELPNIFEICEVEPLEELELLLDKGESEAITLAIKMGLPLIIDEKKGRKIAKNFGLKIIGLVGILVLNVEKGYLTKNEAIEFLMKVREEGFRISEKLLSEFAEMVKG